MKRSEMLKIIWDVLHPTEIGWEDLDGSLSEEVLKAIEKTGLLPHWTDRGSYEEE